MQGLVRLAGWGAAAAVSLLLVVIAANSSVGRERLSGAFAEVNGTREAEAAKAQTAQAAQLARLATNENDTRRLIEIVRSMASDRERLMARVGVLERNIEDVTGKLQKQPTATPPAPPAATPQAPTAATTPQPPPAAAAEPPPKTAAAPPHTIPAEPSPAAAPAAPPPAPPRQVASLPPASSMPELEAIPARAAGVDVGGATSFDGLRTLWNTITATHYDLFEGLNPIVAVRENSKSRAADLRLVAGPITDIETANRICSTLAAAKRYCRLVTFEGQPLAMVAPEAPRRPAAKTRPQVRTPAP
jgi:hypothetical protein